jgi:hypothetical protein
MSDEEINDADWFGICRLRHLAARKFSLQRYGYHEVTRTITDHHVASIVVVVVVVVVIVA